MKIALYPGTFDPVTRGHLDVLKRACEIFDKVIISVAVNEDKNPLFTIEERTELIRENLEHIPNAEVASVEGLLVDFARQVGAKALIRGLRAVSDFEFELQMAQMNRNLDEEVETLFLVPNEAYTFISSKLIKQVANYGGDIRKFVPRNVYEALCKKLPELKQAHQSREG